MALLDYRGSHLKAKGRGVGWPSQTGLLIEHAVGAKCGISALAPCDLPTSLQWTLDDFRGNQQVVTYADDRALAVRCAKQVRRDEHAAGFGQLSTIVRERARLTEVSTDGRMTTIVREVVSDHDQILEVVDGPPIGKVSAELRARVIHNERHLGLYRMLRLSHKPFVSRVQLLRYQPDAW